MRVSTFKHRIEMLSHHIPSLMEKMDFGIAGLHINYCFPDLTNRLLFVYGNKGGVHVLDSSTLQILGVIKSSKSYKVSFIELSIEQHYLAVVYQNLIVVYSLIDMEIVAQIASPSGEDCLFATFSYDGKYFAAGYNDGAFQLFHKNEKELTLAKEVNFHSAILGSCFSAGSSLLCLSFANGRALLMSLVTNHVWNFKAHKKEVDAILIGVNDSSTFMTVSKKAGEVKYWALKDSNVVLMREFTIKKHIVSFTQSCNGMILCVCSSMQMYAWVVESGALLNKYDKDGLEIFQIVNIAAHPLLPHIMLIITKDTIALWNVMTNDIKIVMNVNYPLFQEGYWFSHATAFVKTNEGTIKFFSYEKQEWNQPYQLDKPIDLSALFKKYFNIALVDPHFPVMAYHEKVMLNSFHLHEDSLEIETSTSEDEDDTSFG